MSKLILKKIFIDIQSEMKLKEIKK